MLPPRSEGSVVTEQSQGAVGALLTPFLKPRMRCVQPTNSSKPLTCSTNIYKVSVMALSAALGLKNPLVNKTGSIFPPFTEKTRKSLYVLKVQDLGHFG